MVRAELALDCSVGIGRSKLVAKLAVEVAKPKPDTGRTGVHIVPPGGEAAFLARFTLGEIPLVGPRFQERLKRHGMTTVPDVLAHDERTLVTWLGKRDAHWLLDRVRGVDHGKVSGDGELKSLSREDTFAADVGDDASLERELLRLVVRASADLRAEGLTARTITVKLRDYDFATRQASRTLDEGVMSDRPIHETARDRALAHTVDALRERFGDDVIGPGALARRGPRDAAPPSR